MLSTALKLISHFDAQLILVTQQLILLFHLFVLVKFDIARDDVLLFVFFDLIVEHCVSYQVILIMARLAGMITIVDIVGRGHALELRRFVVHNPNIFIGAFLVVILERWSRGQGFNGKVAKIGLVNLLQFILQL